MIRQIFRWVLVLSSTVGLALAGTEDSDKLTLEVLYKNPSRTFYEKFSTKSWIGGNIIPKRLLISQEKDVFFDESTGTRLHDCSDGQYRCIVGLSRVFAVPRARLSPTATYLAGGAVFKVEECLRGNASICQVALISSDCRQVSDEACEEVVGGRARSANPGPIIYFIYNEDFGVTAYGSAKAALQTLDERRACAAQMILQGQTGLLARHEGAGL